VGIFNAKHNEPRLKVVGNILARLRQRVNCNEISPIPEVDANSSIEFLHHLVGISFELFGSVFRNFRDSGLSRVPIARSIVIEVSRGAAQTPQCIDKNGRRLAGHHAAQLDAAILQSAMCSRRSWRGTEINGPRDTSTCRKLA